MTDKKSFPQARKRISVKEHTSFKIGGDAEYFLTVKTEEELVQGIEKARELNVPFFVLGGGSNVLFPDKEWKGLVLKNEISGIDLKKKKEGSRIIGVKSGTMLFKVLSFSLDRGLSGLEWAAGIPGTAGGAIRGNAGAFNRSMSDSVVSVDVFDAGKMAIRKLKNKDCKFGYRESVFKKNGDLVILSADIELEIGDRIAVDGEMRKCFQKRKNRQPHGFSAGSVFKNYEIRNLKEKKAVLQKNPEIEKIISGGMIPAAFLIEKCGLKGKVVGKAMFSRVHANFIVNLGNAKSGDVKKLMTLAKEKVKKKFGILLEEEIIIINS